MYCLQCGKKISENANFCSNCGCCVEKEGENGFESMKTESFDAVEDIKQKLRDIDNQPKPQTKKEDVLKSTINVIKGKTSIFDVVFEENFEAKKIEEKKILIAKYQLPKSSKELANFAKYINSQIETKKKEPDPLMDVWKEKMNQLYLFASKELSKTEEFIEIQKYYKYIKRRERYESIRVPFTVIFAYLILGAYITSMLNQWPLMLFVSIVVTGWGIFLILHLNGLLEKLVMPIIKHSETRQDVPKWLRVVAWIIFIPVLAALITVVVYDFEGLIFSLAMLLGVDTMFILWFVCDAYGW